MGTTTKNALGPQSAQVLQSLLSVHSLLVFDFDGTLAPIVAHPDQARVNVAMARALEALKRHHTVVILTGREVTDVRNRLSFAPDHILGNHGAEDPDLPDTNRISRALDPVRTALQGGAHHTLTAAGVHVEDKHLSLAFHYRLAKDRDLARQSIDAFLASCPQGLRCFDGKMVVNLMAQDVHALSHRTGLASVLFAGDDVNDEPVFERRLAHWFTVRVGSDGQPTAAEYGLGSTTDMAIFLNLCLRLTTAPERV